MKTQAPRFQTKQNVLNMDAAAPSLASLSISCVALLIWRLWSHFLRAKAWLSGARCCLSRMLICPKSTNTRSISPQWLERTQNTATIARHRKIRCQQLNLRMLAGNAMVLKSSKVAAREISTALLSMLTWKSGAAMRRMLTVMTVTLTCARCAHAGQSIVSARVPT